MKGFSGFPSGKIRSTPVPDPFFTELLTQIDHLGELKITLYCFWRLSLKDGKIRYLRFNEILADENFVQSISRTPREAQELLHDSIERAVARGTLLHIQVESAADVEDLYFVNTPKGRAAVDGITKGEWRPTTDDGAPVEVLIARPNAFVLYEQNIGALTPLIADELRDIESNYPAEWIEEAIGEAVENNARSLRYISRILENWKAKGKVDSGRNKGNSEKSRRRYLDYLDE